MANVKLDGKTMPEASFRVTSRGCKDSYGLNNLQAGSNVELVEYNGAKAKVELTTDRENGKIVKPTENSTPLAGLQCHQCAVNQNRLTDEQYLDMAMDGCFNATLGTFDLNCPCNDTRIISFLETVATCDPRLGEDVSKFGTVFKAWLQLMLTSNQTVKVLTSSRVASEAKLFILPL